MKHEILSIETPPNSGRFETTTWGDTTHLGIEAGVSTLLPLGFMAPTDALDLHLTYTWNHFRFDGDPRFGNNELPSIPEHVLNLEALYRHPSGFFFGPNLQAASSWFADQANSLQADSFAIVGLRAGYANKRRGIRMFVDVRGTSPTKPTPLPPSSWRTPVAWMRRCSIPASIGPCSWVSSSIRDFCND